MDQALTTLGVDKVVSIWYHMNWPSPGNDPWYLNNPTENTGRRTYYGVNAIPWGFCDGTNVSLGSTAIINAVNNRLAIASPYEMEVTGDIGTSSVSVKVKATSTPPSGTKWLRIAVVEKEYTSPIPYPNGSTHYRTSMLDMVPDANGTLLNIAVGDSQTFNFNYNPVVVNFHPSFDLTIVAFVQNDGTKEVLQAGYFNGGVGLEGQKTAALIESNSTANLSGFIFNDFSNASNLSLRIKGQIPAGWNITATSPQGPIPINGPIQNITVNGYDSLFFDIAADPQGNGGAAILTAKMMLPADTSVYEELQFSIVTKNVDVLLVDRDGGANYETYIINALNQTSYSYGIIPIQPGDIVMGDLDGIPVVIWNCGLTEPTLIPDEMDALRSYLDTGGRLYLNGVDMAYQLADPASPYHTANSLDFFNNYLHANYVTRIIFTLAVNGVSGDPISNGISQMLLVGGTGAGNLGGSTGKYPNQIGPNDANAMPIFTFLGGTKVAGIRVNHSSGKIVFTTFGLEAIAQDSLRTKVMGRALDWLVAPVAINNEEGPLLIKTLQLDQNYPNPFNPGTTISYLLPVISSDRHVSLNIYNQLGQKVRALVSEDQESGKYEISWDGLDDNGLQVASGVYFYQLRYGSHKATQKMLLIR